MSATEIDTTAIDCLRASLYPLRKVAEQIMDIVISGSVASGDPVTAADVEAAITEQIDLSRATGLPALAAASVLLALAAFEEAGLFDGK